MHAVEPGSGFPSCLIYDILHKTWYPEIKIKKKKESRHTVKKSRNFNETNNVSVILFKEYIIRNFSFLSWFAYQIYSTSFHWTYKLQKEE